MEFTPDRIAYHGYGAYEIPYKNIMRIALKERKGFLGRERFLFFVARDAYGNMRSYLIPRWHTLAGGVLNRILDERMKLSILNRGLLSFYAAFPEKDWLTPLALGILSVHFGIFFFLAKSKPETFASTAIGVWLAILVATAIILLRHFQKKSKILFENNNA